VSITRLCLWRALAVALILLTAALPAHAQPRAGSLAGTVRDAAGAALPAVTVVATAPSHAARTVETGADGRYRIEGVAAGVHRVEFSLSGFASVTRSVVVTADGTTPLDVLLTLATSDTITVTAVTATKQRADVQTAPVSVGVMSAAEVAASRITDFATATDYLPSLRYVDFAGRGVFGFLTLRGQTNSQTALDPSATLYVDGVPYSDFFSLDQGLFDVASIEVLRGPQSTLYGGFTQAGVIAVQSRAPDDTTRGTVTLRSGSFGRSQMTAVASGALAPGTVFAGVAASVSGGHALVNNVGAGRGREFAWALRSRLRWKASSRLELNLINEFQRIDDTNGYLSVPTDTAGYNAMLEGLGSSLRVGRFERATDHQGYRKSDTRRHAVTGQWSGDEAEVVTTVAWRKNSPEYSFDLDETPLPLLTADAGGTYMTELYAEARVQTTPSLQRAWSGLVGVSVDRQFQQQNAGVTDLAGAFGGPPGSRLDAYLTTLRSPLFGVFGQGTWRTASRRTGITAGLRYDHATRYAFQAPGGFLGTGFEADKTTSAVLPKVAVDHARTPRHTVYASVAAGWKPGGANIYAPDITLAPYDAERSWTYEAGSKWRSGSDRLRVNATAFYTDIRDYQDTIYLTAFTQYLGNADRVGIAGGELEVAVAPVRRFDLNVALGHARGRFRDYVRNPVSGFRLDGHRLSDIPDWDLAATAQYRWDRGWLARAELIASGAIEASRFSAADAASGTQDLLKTQFLDGARVINLRVGYKRARWSVFAGAGNLTDRLYFNHAQARVPPGYRGFLGSVGARRVLDLTFTVGL
jgi:iron complex outermembrane recepter protein